MAGAHAQEGIGLREKVTKEASASALFFDVFGTISWAFASMPMRIRHAGHDQVRATLG
jgi:hypothetical protein